MGAERGERELIICNVFFVRGNKHPNNKENIANNLVLKRQYFLDWKMYASFEHILSNLWRKYNMQNQLFPPNRHPTFLQLQELQIS